MALALLFLIFVKTECAAKAIAWVQVGKKAATPHTCDIEFADGRTYLAFTLRGSGGRHREPIDGRMLLRLLPDQWEGVDYIYQPAIRLEAE